jgi:hypothetical protein
MMPFAILLVAIVIFRAALPAGFMPASAEGRFPGLVICQGVLPAEPPTKPSDPDRAVDECPFAAVRHASDVLAPSVTTGPARTAWIGHRPVATVWTSIKRRSGALPLGARAPPSSRLDERSQT